MEAQELEIRPQRADEIVGRMVGPVLLEDDPVRVGKRGRYGIWIDLSRQDGHEALVQLLGVLPLDPADLGGEEVRRQDADEDVRFLDRLADRIAPAVGGLDAGPVDEHRLPALLEGGDHVPDDALVLTRVGDEDVGHGASRAYAVRRTASTPQKLSKLAR